MIERAIGTMGTEMIDTMVALNIIHDLVHTADQDLQYQDDVHEQIQDQDLDLDRGHDQDIVQDRGQGHMIDTNAKKDDHCHAAVMTVPVQIHQMTMRAV